MSNLCLNCSKQISDSEEFCEACEADLNVMVDVNLDPVVNIVDTKANPLFQTRKITGSLVGDDPDIIGNRMRRDEGSIMVFWGGLLVMVFIMILIVIVAN